MKHLLLLLCVVFGVKALDSSSVSEDIHVEGGVLTRVKKNFFQFGAMIACKVKRNPLDYNGYGCWCRCGIGGKGEPVDDIDQCCKVHVKCYNNIVKKKYCGSKAKVNFPPYLIKKGTCTRCASRPRNNRCKKKVCECDAAAARCFKKYDSKFKNRFKNFKQSKC